MLYCNIKKIVQVRNMFFGRSAVFIIFIIAGAALPASAAPKVVASIMPLHSLASSLMKGIGVPTLLIPSNVSPHRFSLKPSQRKAIADADLVFWVGHGIEGRLSKLMSSKRTRALSLIKSPGLQILKARSGGVWGSHDGHDHHDHHGHGEHADNTKDMHIWLDPANARLMVQAMVRALSEADKKNQSLYEANGKKLLEDLKKLEDEITRALTPVKNKPFIVFHDAFQYFERRFGLNGAGALMVHSGHSPSAKRLFEVRKKILQAGVSCVFREPQFDGRLAESVVRGTSAKIGILDPLGSDIAPGPTGYSQLIRSNAKNLSGCLKN